jgi:hypothetical protein
MFQMTVEDAVKVHENLVSVSGPCVNKREFFSGSLSDGQGHIYEAHIPFDKTLVFDDSSVIIGIYGNVDAEALLGRTLVST